MSIHIIFITALVIMFLYYLTQNDNEQNNKPRD